MLDLLLIKYLFGFFSLLYFSYLDIFNNKNINEAPLYFFISLSFFLGLFSFDAVSFFFAIILATSLFFSYRTGAIGGADVFIIVGLAFLLPPINLEINQIYFHIPLIILLLLNTFNLFSLMFIFSYILKFFKLSKQSLLITNNKKLQILFFLISSFILFFFYIVSKDMLQLFYISSALSFFALLIFNIFKNNIDEIKSHLTPLNQIDDEDIIDVEKNKQIFNLTLPKIFHKQQIPKLKKQGIEKLFVYKSMPAFVPFLFFSYIITLLIFIFKLVKI